MPSLRRRIATIVEAHLEEVLDQMMAAFAAELESVASADAAKRERVRAGTRRASLSFLAMYADPDTPARPVLAEARRSTLGRAGQDFDRDEILAMFRIARQVLFQAARALAMAELELPPDRTHEFAAAMDRFLDEMEHEELELESAPDALFRFLSDAENEGPQLT